MCNETQVTTDLKEYGEDGIAYIQAMVSKELEKLFLGIREWEKNYFVNNSFSAPSQEVFRNDKFISEVQKKIQYATAILKEPKVDISNNKLTRLWYI